MKKALKIAGLSLALALSASLANAAENIAFINSAYLFQNHPDREAAGAKIDAELKAPAEKLQASEKAIVTKIEALQKEASKLRAADIQKREDEINKMREAYQKQAEELQAQNEELQYQERSKLLSSIQNATNEVAAKGNYSYVIDANAVVYAAAGKDITEEVLKAIKPAAAPAEAKK
ncbi:OmpH family outer membrane protein [Testudinibacter sp. TR-2022]|uniref:OmpH family outer membrane protein n=1 Tax=Testudinibacter sp. TR-2022 TaxID=2585029 RepID=UPI001119CCFA|nr:OmpH family outer membrane protein [Testudinibacter sp. TR-2022]TNH06961.1 hypothetical protein FHQ30_05885 [Pasteurellaceae bacterium Phil11]TNH23382.1 hypothetical protein FHQ29_05710 [Testudinibacter sp. TR-2022]TNH27966.1 hypothetical protein FHQ27_03875 [Testudinibacter sp. TR-2022]